MVKTTAVLTDEAVRKTRTPSPFKPAARVTISLHHDVHQDALMGISDVPTTVADDFGQRGFATRIVTRERKPRKSRKTGQLLPPSGPWPVMIYVAPEGFEFTHAVERGVRLDSETARLLRSVAERMGLDPNDPASISAVAKALAQKAS